MSYKNRAHPLWFAYVVHRLSGLGLTLFLPLHFLLLSRGLNESALDAALQFTNHPLVKAAEFGLVFLLAVHLFGGIRLLALEWLPWPSNHKTLAAACLAVSLMVSGIFLLQVI